MQRGKIVCARVIRILRQIGNDLSPINRARRNAAALSCSVSPEHLAAVFPDGRMLICLHSSQIIIRQEDAELIPMAYKINPAGDQVQQITE